LSMVKALNESEVVEIGVAESPLDDVMLTVNEILNGKAWPVPARQMSDGSLRFLALVAALLQVPLAEDVRKGPDPAAQTTLVIEELENGLHPSQAAQIIGLLREQARIRDVRVVATTHSPAILDALPGEMHNSVIVCWRDKANSRSRLCRLPELDSYIDVVTSGTLGDAAIADELRMRSVNPQSPRDALDALFSA
jgi:predicted ATPase